MLNFIKSIIAYNFYKITGFPKILPIILTFSVNDWCNSKCKTCNIWKNNPMEKIKEELALDEISRIFANFNKLYWLTITGGETFLRNDLNEIIKTIYDRSKPKVITIATNGMTTKKIILWTQDILDYCKQLNLVINLSLDGIGKQHDEIRGVKNNFDLTTKTLIELKKLNHPRLTVGVNTVISNYNVKDFPEIYTYIKNNFGPDSYIAEVAEHRAKLYNIELEITPEINEYQKALLFLIDSLKTPSERHVPEIIRILRMEFYEYLMKQYSLKNFEGIASAYIMHNGDVWSSYTRPFVIGNLREVNYDFKKLWFNGKAKHFRKVMNNAEYNTTLANAFYTNILCSPSKILKLWLDRKIKSLSKKSFQ